MGPPPKLTVPLAVPMMTTLPPLSTATPLPTSFSPPPNALDQAGAPAAAYLATKMLPEAARPRCAAGRPGDRDERRVAPRRPAIIRDGELRGVGARGGIGVTRRRTGGRGAVSEVPGIGRDRTVLVGTGAPERHRAPLD